MGKKGKNKNATVVNESSPKLEEVVEKKLEVKTEPPKVEIKKEPTVEIKPVEEKPKVIETSESNADTLKSKKKRNKNNKSNLYFLTHSNPFANKLLNLDQATEDAAESIQEAPKSEVVEIVKDDTVNDECPDANASDTLKRKRKRNRKKNTTGVEIATELKEENIEETPDIEQGDSSDTLKKKKRNRNKNKKTSNETLVNEALAAAATAPPPNISDISEGKSDNQSRKNKKQKRSDLTSKKTINDEIQERQDREQKEARDHICNEIAKREKLLSTIDMVFDIHKSEVELAKNQQESLKDLSSLAASSAPAPKQQAPQLLPKNDELVDKIEQALGVTKLEIKNVHSQQAFVGRLEDELAKVKQSKDKLLRGDYSEATPSNAVPPQIKEMTKQLCDLTKETPKSKDELIKEIQNRDKLMSEINRVLDTTKTEIEKVQKQQKIISNLEGELQKIKDQEFADTLMLLEEEALRDETPKKPSSSATASLLDALMANVGKLKEAQAMKDKSEDIGNVTEHKKASSPKNEKKSNKRPNKNDDNALIVEQKLPVEEKVDAPIVVEQVKQEKRIENKVEAKLEEIKVLKIEPNIDELKNVEEVLQVELQKHVVEQPKIIETHEVPSVEITTKQADEIKTTEKAPDNKSSKKHEKIKKDSPKGKSKNNQNNKKESSEMKQVEEQSTANQKLSMADMLKNAPDPTPEELKKNEEEINASKLEEVPIKLPEIEETKIELAPLARPESAIIEKPILPPPIVEDKKIEEIIKPIEVVVEQKAIVEADKKDEESMVVVSQAEVAQMMLEMEKNELADSKNAEGGDFASLVKDQKETVKSPITPKKDEKPSKSAKPSIVKTSGKGPQVKSTSPVKPATKIESTRPRPDVKKPQPPKALLKQQKSTEALPKAQESSLESSPKSAEIVSNVIEPIAIPSPQSSTPEKPKIPAKPDVQSKTVTTPPKPASSASPPRAQAGNVTKTTATSSPSRPTTKSNTPTPPQVSKPVSSPSNVTPTTPAANPRPTAPPPTTSSKPTNNQTKKSPPTKSNASKPAATIKQPKSNTNTVNN